MMRTGPLNPQQVHSWPTAAGTSASPASEQPSVAGAGTADKPNALQDTSQDQIQMQSGPEASALPQIDMGIMQFFEVGFSTDVADAYQFSAASAHVFDLMQGNKVCGDDYRLQQQDISALDTVRGHVFKALQGNQREDLLQVLDLLQTYPESLSPEQAQLLEAFSIELDAEGHFWMQDLNGERQLMTEEERSVLCADLGKIAQVLHRDNDAEVNLEIAYLNRMQQAFQELGILDAVTAELDAISTEVQAMQQDLAADLSLTEELGALLQRVHRPSDLTGADESLLARVGIERQGGRFIYTSEDGRSRRVSFGDLRNLLRGRQISLGHQIELKRERLLSRSADLQVQQQEVATQTERVERVQQDLDEAYQALPPVLQNKYEGQYRSLKQEFQDSLARAHQSLARSDEILEALDAFLDEVLHTLNEVFAALPDLSAFEGLGVDFVEYDVETLEPEPVRPAVSEPSAAEDLQINSAWKELERARQASAKVDEQLEAQGLSRQIKLRQKQQAYHELRLQGQGQMLAPLPDIAPESAASDSASAP